MQSKKLLFNKIFAVFSVKKLALVLAIFLLMTVASINADIVVNTIIQKLTAGPKVLIPATKAPPILLLQCVPYIYYPVWFKKNKSKIQIPLDFSYEVNVITSVYAAKQDLKFQPINNKA